MLVITRDAIAGALYGVALGDALGRPTEFMSLRAIHSQYGNSGELELPNPALFTDDTQLTLAVARALAHHAHTASRLLRHEFIDWRTVDEPRAPGAACLQATYNMMRLGSFFTSWEHCTSIESKGCGANMRVAPAAFIKDESIALGFAQLQAAMTHGHPTAIAASELTAIAIRWAASGTPLNAAFASRLLDHAYVQQQSIGNGYHSWLGQLSDRWDTADTNLNMVLGWQECIDALRRTRDALECTYSHADVCAFLGQGWVAEETLAVALYFAGKYSSNPVLAISEAARTNGDSDSIACVTGALVGAVHGEFAWPEAWRSRIERRSDIETAINTCWAAHIGT